MIAWRYAVQSSKALPVTAAPLLLPHVGTLCPCRPSSASSGYSYTIAGPESLKCCWWIKCRQQRAGATLFYMGTLCFSRHPWSGVKLTPGSYWKCYPALMTLPYLTFSSFLNLVWLPESNPLLALTFSAFSGLIPGGHVPRSISKGREQLSKREFIEIWEEYKKKEPEMGVPSYRDQRPRFTRSYLQWWPFCKV